MNYIVWNPSVEIFHIGGFSLLWYGVLFAIGLVAAGSYVYKQSLRAGLTERRFNALVLLLFAGIFLGARLCHCVFYDPQYFFSHPLEIFLPITKNAAGNYYFCGYHGLASHGGGVGAIVAILIFKLMYRDEKLMPILDIVAIATPLLGGFIRIGNFFNSEILGTESSLPWAVIFSSVDDVPRHPVQIYEAIFYFLLFFVLAAAYRTFSQNSNEEKIINSLNDASIADVSGKNNEKITPVHCSVKPGFWFSMVMITIPIFRFFVEFCKMEQINYTANLPLNMGQLLSIPLFLCGLFLLIITQFFKGKNLH